MPDMVFSQLKTDQKNEVFVGTIEVEVSFPDGRPAAGRSYELRLDGGEVRKGVLDSAGRLIEANIPPGKKGELTVEGAPIIAVAE